MSDYDDLLLTGDDLTIPTLVAASRIPPGNHLITLHSEARDRMISNRAFVEKVASRGDDVYGLTTGVGMRKTRKISDSDMVQFNMRMIIDHATGQGPPLSSDVTRAAAILLLNTLAKGYSNVRLEVADKISHRLSYGPPLNNVPMYGTTGVGDVTNLAHLTRDLLGDMPPAAGEALPLIAQSSFVTAYAAIAIHGTRKLLEQCLVLAVLDLEAFAANPAPFHSSVASVRPYPGSRLLTESPRALQPPLSFRCAAVVLGAAYDALSFCENQISIELNAHQQNPFTNEQDDRMIPVAHFDMQAVASALDFMRIALVPCLTSQAERSIKLLQKSLTELTDGLEPRGDEGGHGLSEITWPLQAMVTEAKLLAQPVSFEVGSSYQAEGLEDRMTMAGLAGRRLHDIIHLSNRILAISSVIATQAIDLRGKERLGEKVATVHSKIRVLIPELVCGQHLPSSFEDLVSEIKRGFLSDI